MLWNEMTAMRDSHNSYVDHDCTHKIGIGCEGHLIIHLDNGDRELEFNPDHAVNLQALLNAKLGLPCQKEDKT